MKSKRGAIELSMTTIIVVIIGVILLSLGIGWITNTIQGIEELTQQSLAKAQETIQRDMPSGDNFYISGYSFSTTGGDFSEIYIGVQFFSDNPDELRYFKLRIVPSEYEEWFELWDILPIKAGERKGIPIGIKVPSNVQPDMYSITLIAQESQDGTNFQDVEGEVILLTVE